MISRICRKGLYGWKLNGDSQEVHIYFIFCFPAQMAAEHTNQSPNNRENKQKKEVQPDACLIYRRVKPVKPAPKGMEPDR